LFYAKGKPEVPSWDELEKEVSFLEKLLSSLGSPVVFCHNDLLLKNIIHHQTPEIGVTFIDFEYADFNFQAFDIANHFCEFAGVDEYIPSLFPDEEFQREWLKGYLSSWKTHNPSSPCDDAVLTISTTNGHNKADEQDKIVVSCSELVDVTEEEVDDLLSQVKRFTLAAHLLWGIWALIQSRHSKIEFDFRQYALDRLDQYRKEKKILSNLNTNGYSHL